MEPPNPFAKPHGWIIKSWTPKNGAPSLVPSGSIVLIGIDLNDPSLYNLAWLDESLRWRCATTKSAADEGAYAITLTAESETRIQGDLFDFGDGNVGTFIAETDPPPREEEG